MWYMISIFPITGGVNFDLLIKVVSAWIVAVKLLFSSL